MADEFQYIKLPDGSYGKFRADAKDEDIKAAISKDFPESVSGKPPVSPTPIPAGLQKDKSLMSKVGAGVGDEAAGNAQMVQEHPGLVAGAGLAGALPAAAIAPAETATVAGEAAHIIGPKLVQAGKTGWQVGKGLAAMKAGQWIGDKLGLKSGELAGLLGVGLGRGGSSSSPESAPVPSSPPPEEGVQVIPEPNPPSPGINPGNMGSVPREELPGLAKRGVAGAGPQMQSIGKKILYQPRPVIGAK